MADIFLSYSREDRPFAEALTRLVEQGGHNVWWDRDIDSGSEFSGEPSKSISSALLAKSSPPAMPVSRTKTTVIATS